MMDSFFSMVMGLVILGAVLYAVFRPRGKTDQKSGRDAYYYIVMFLALMPLFWGVADLGRLVLENVWGTRTSYYYGSSAEADLRRVSLRMSAMVVGLPMFVFHAYKVGLRKKEETDWTSQRTYAMAVLILTSVMVLVVGIWLVYHGFNAILGVADRDMKAQLAYAVPYVVTAAGVWVWHMRVWRSGEKEKATVATKD